MQHRAMRHVVVCLNLAPGDLGADPAQAAPADAPRH
jgi:hypothetical protein